VNRPRVQIPTSRKGGEKWGTPRVFLPRGFSIPGFFHRQGFFRPEGFRPHSSKEA
jgi:hypothetical protein